MQWEGRCHTGVRAVLSWVFFVLWISCFILKSDSPLISGHLPFLSCHRSDVSPNPWLFPPVYLSLVYILSLSSPCLVARVFRPVVYVQPPYHSLATVFVKYCLAWFSVILCSPLMLSDFDFAKVLVSMFFCEPINFIVPLSFPPSWVFWFVVLLAQCSLVLL